jgi:hypothetical protein
MPEPDFKGLITLHEAVRVSGLSMATLWRRLSSGELEGTHVLGRLLVRERQVRKLRARGEAGRAGKTASAGQ